MMARCAFSNERYCAIGLDASLGHVQYATAGLFLGIRDRLSSSFSSGTRIASGITITLSLFVDL